ncbi:MAG: hypothetical protein Kow0047_01000 [Anaerolineae bacterium]
MDDSTALPSPVGETSVAFDLARLARSLRLALTLRGLVISVFGALLPSAIATFGLTDAEVSVLPVATGLAATLGPMTVGWLTQRQGPRLGMILTAAALLLSACLLWAAPLWAAFVTGAFAMSWGASGMATAISVILAEAYRSRSGAAFNSSFLFVGVGSLISPLLAAAVLALGYPWRATFALLALAFTVLLWLASSLPYDVIARPHEAHRGETEGKPWWQQRVIVLCALALVCYVGAEVGLTTWIARYLVAHRGVDLAVATMSPSVFWAGMIVGRWAFSRGLIARNEKQMVTWAGWGGVASVIGIVALPGGVWPWLSLLVAGATFGGLWPTIMSYAAVRSSGHTGAASGLLIALGFLGALIVPALIGLSSSWIGLGASLLLVPLMIALTFVLFLAA